MDKNSRFIKLSLAGRFDETSSEIVESEVYVRAADIQAVGEEPKDPTIMNRWNSHDLTAVYLEGRKLLVTESVKDVMDKVTASEKANDETVITSTEGFDGPITFPSLTPLENILQGDTDDEVDEG